MSIQKAKQILKQVFGYDEFRHGQEPVIAAALAQQDVLAIMPTGGGKSLCYQIPALVKDQVSLVISPLISLMQDQVKNLELNGVACAFYNSSLSPSEKQDLEERLLTNKIKILYIAPESILRNNIIYTLRQLNIAFIAVDEAHCVSQWGHEFRQDYTRLHELREQFPKASWMALTATADEKTRKDIIAQLKLQNAKVYIAGFDRPNIRYMVHERIQEIKQLHDFIQKNHKNDTGIVYCISRKKVEKVCEALRKLGHKAIAYHAGLSAQKRALNQALFDTEENLVVVATIAFGMGIDRPDVRFVAHLDMPKSVESYYQETGRAGRDGKAANAYMIYGLNDVVQHSRMLDTTDAGEEYKRSARQKLNALLSFCESGICRRYVLLDYFGEKNLKSECGNCDICLEPVETWDATIAAQKLLSCIYRTGQTYGANYIIDVLCGSQNEKVLNNKHDQLSVFGIGKDIHKNEWNSILRQLLNLKFISIKNWEYRNLVLEEKSRPILRSEEKIFLKKLRQHNKKKDSDKKTVFKKNEALSVAEGQEELFLALKELRLRLAKEKNVPPYIVFSDKSLNDMCHIMPKNEEQMLLVNGVGKAKLELYGADFLNTIAKFQ